MVPPAVLVPSSIPSLYPLISAIAIVSFILICVIAASVAFLVLIILGIYALIEYIFFPYFAAASGDNDDPDLELGNRLTRAWNPRALSRRQRRRPKGTEATEQALLDQELLPSVVYGTVGEIRSKSSDCAVCLDDFVEGESCQVFPSCRHMFHSSCIDRWLRAHLSCPVCRNSVFCVS